MAKNIGAVLKGFIMGNKAAIVAIISSMRGFWNCKVRKN
jgi:hypothetical protein